MWVRVWMVVLWVVSAEITHNVIRRDAYDYRQRTNRKAHNDYHRSESA